MSLILKTESDSKAAQEDLAKLKTAVVGMEASVRKSTESFIDMAKAIAASSAAFAGLKGLMSLSDQFTNLENKINSVNDSLKASNFALGEIKRIAITSRTSLEAVATAYQRIRLNASEIGINQKDTLRTVQTLSRALKISGTNAEDANKAIIQFGQGIGAGVLNGDELKSLMENAPMIAKSISKGLGVQYGELKKLGEEGALTSSKVLQAILKDADNIDKKFSGIRVTFADAFQTVGTATKVLFNTLSQKFFGSTNVIAEWIQKAGESIFNFAVDIDYYFLKAKSSVLFFVIDAVNFFKEFWDVLKETGGRISELISQLFEEWKPQLKQTTDTLSKWATEASAAILSVFVATRDYISGSSFYQGIVTGLTKLSNYLKVNITNIFDNLGIELPEISSESLKRGLYEAYTTVSTFAQRIVSSVKSAFSSLTLPVFDFSRVTTAFAPMLAFVEKWTASIRHSFSSMFSGLFEIDAKAFFKNFEPVLKFVQEWAYKIERAFFWVYDQVIAHSWIPDLVNGVTMWLKKLVGAPLAFVSQFATRASSIFAGIKFGLPFITVFTVFKRFRTEIALLSAAVLGFIGLFNSEWFKNQKFEFITKFKMNDSLGAFWSKTEVQLRKLRESLSKSFSESTFTRTIKQITGQHDNVPGSVFGTTIDTRDQAKVGRGPLRSQDSRFIGHDVINALPKDWQIPVIVGVGAAVSLAIYKAFGSGQVSSVLISLVTSAFGIGIARIVDDSAIKRFNEKLASGFTGAVGKVMDFAFQGNILKDPLAGISLLAKTSLLFEKGRETALEVVKALVTAPTKAALGVNALFEKGMAKMDNTALTKEYGRLSENLNKVTQANKQAQTALNKLAAMKPTANSTAYGMANAKQIVASGNTNQGPISGQAQMAVVAAIAAANNAKKFGGVDVKQLTAQVDEAKATVDESKKRLVEMTKAIDASKQAFVDGFRNIGAGIGGTLGGIGGYQFGAQVAESLTNAPGWQKVAITLGSAITGQALGATLGVVITSSIVGSFKAIPTIFSFAFTPLIAILATAGASLSKLLIPITTGATLPWIARLSTVLAGAVASMSAAFMAVAPWVVLAAIVYGTFVAGATLFEKLPEKWQAQLRNTFVPQVAREAYENRGSAQLYGMKFLSATAAVLADLPAVGIAFKTLAATLDPKIAVLQSQVDAKNAENVKVNNAAYAKAIKEFSDTNLKFGANVEKMNAPKGGLPIESFSGNKFEPASRPRGFATGGFVSGSGTGTSDSIPAKLSNGEFVVNAAITKKYRDLLERINNGHQPTSAELVDAMTDGLAYKYKLPKAPPSRLFAAGYTTAKMKGATGFDPEELLVSGLGIRKDTFDDIKKGNEAAVEGAKSEIRSRLADTMLLNSVVNGSSAQGVQALTTMLTSSAGPLSALNKTFLASHIGKLVSVGLLTDQFLLPSLAGSMRAKRVATGEVTGFQGIDDMLMSFEESTLLGTTEKYTAAIVSKLKEILPDRILPKFASGGFIRGSGTGTSDSIPALLSNGEFVVNADASRRYGSMLNAINSGSLPRFAAGGAVGAAQQVRAIDNAIASNTAIQVRDEELKKGLDKIFDKIIKAVTDNNGNFSVSNLTSALSELVQKALAGVPGLPDGKPKTDGTTSPITTPTGPTKEERASLKYQLKNGKDQDKILKDAFEKAGVTGYTKDSFKALGDRTSGKLIDAMDNLSRANYEAANNPGVLGSSARSLADEWRVQINEMIQRAQLSGDAVSNWKTTKDDGKGKDPEILKFSDQLSIINTAFPKLDLSLKEFYEMTDKARETLFKSAEGIFKRSKDIDEIQIGELGKTKPQEVAAKRKAVEDDRKAAEEKARADIRVARTPFQNMSSDLSKVGMTIGEDVSNLFENDDFLNLETIKLQMRDAMKTLTAPESNKDITQEMRKQAQLAARGASKQLEELTNGVILRNGTAFEQASAKANAAGIALEKSMFDRMNSAELAVHDGFMKKLTEQSEGLKSNEPELRAAAFKLVEGTKKEYAKWLEHFGESKGVMAGKAFASSVTQTFDTSLQGLLKGQASNGRSVISTFAHSVLNGLTNSVIDSFTKGISESLFGDGKSLTKMLEGIGSSIFSGGGGFLSSIASIFGFADGGFVSGAGNGTSDSIPAMLSNGEFVVNAKATKAFAPLLHSINSGNFGKFSDGGIAGTVPSFAAPTPNGTKEASQQVFNINITGDISRQTKQEIFGMLPAIAAGVNSHNREKGR